MEGGRPRNLASTSPDNRGRGIGRRPQLEPLAVACRPLGATSLRASRRGVAARLPSGRRRRRGALRWADHRSQFGCRRPPPRVDSLHVLSLEDGSAGASARALEEDIVVARGKTHLFGRLLPGCDVSFRATGRRHLRRRWGDRSIATILSRCQKLRTMKPSVRARCYYAPSLSMVSHARRPPACSAAI